MRLGETFILALALFGLTTCDNPPAPGPPSNSSTLSIVTSKSVYKPGETVTLTANEDLPPGARVRYRNLDQLIMEEEQSARNWTWKLPADDFQGYLVDLYSIEDGREVIQASVAIDASSDWSRFPRYGFLSKFPQMNDGEMDGVIAQLARFHINGLQFYDWEEKHHKPLAGTVSDPAADWLDIANRPIHGSTVQGYISRAKAMGMNSMSYNLCYGALDDARADGVDDSWYLYTDPVHASKSKFDVVGFLKSPIYLMDPANSQWQQYIANRNEEMYSVYNFDGYHIDQLGYRGDVYDYSGNPVDLRQGFNPFVTAMKALNPSKRLVFNAVVQYGQQEVATAPVDFLYSEIWSPDETYQDLARIITTNDAFSGGRLRTVLAAYMNYQRADNPGLFNTPSVLFSDAVIFAFGGAHIELGEHMLGKEYFPSSNLSMPYDLFTALIRYYDFSVAYQNLLRDGGVFNSPSVASSGTQSIATWPPQQGTITVVGKQVGNKQVVHLLNFTNNSLDWRDTNATKLEPAAISNFTLSIAAMQTVSKVWLASPDNDFGVAIPLTFQQAGNTVTLTIPSLKYWDMIVME